MKKDHAATTSDLLRAERVVPLLTNRWLARNYVWLDTTDSTNRVALELGRSGAELGTTVVAEAQRAGRGRLGRSFFSPPRQNLYASIVLTPRLTAACSPTAVLAAAVAVAETVAWAAGDSDAVEIKWPNDVLLDGRKTSGILMEAGGSGPDRYCALGIGINLNTPREQFPNELRGSATSLIQFRGAPVARAPFAAHLFDKLERVLECHGGGGFEALRPAFEARFRMAGSRVRVSGCAPASRQSATGTALGIATDGSLRLLRDDGREERLVAGDVSVAVEMRR